MSQIRDEIKEVKCTADGRKKIRHKMTCHGMSKILESQTMWQNNYRGKVGAWEEKRF